MTETSKQYALALFSLSSDAQIEDRVEKEFSGFVNGLDEMARKFFLNPKIHVKDKHQVIENVLKQELLVNFIKTVIDNGRFHLLEEMSQAYQDLLNDKKEIAELVVYTKHALSSVQKEKIKQKFENVLSKKIIINEVIQPSIVGGVRIEYQGKVLDQTINASLDQLKSSLIG